MQMNLIIALTFDSNIGTRTIYYQLLKRLPRIVSEGFIPADDANIYSITANE